MPEADRTRLAARLPAEYLGFGYAPLMPADLTSVANIAGDLSSASLGAVADGAAIAASQAQARADRIAVGAAAHGAAAMVTATVDRAVGRRLNDTGIWSVVRATPFWSFGPDGALVESAPDVLPWDFGTDGSPRGVTFGGAITNRIRNPRGEGLIPGTPGTQPTFWAINNQGSALTREVVGRFIVDGIEVVRIRFSGFHTTAGPLAIVFENAIGITGLSTGMRVVNSFYARLHAGALPSGTIGNIWGPYLDSLSVSRLDTQPPLSPALSSTLTFYRRIEAMPSTGTPPYSQNNFALLFYLANNVTVDFTVDVGLPFASVAPFPHFPVLPPIGTPGVSTRAQGLVSIPVPQLGARFNRRQGVLVVEWNSQPGPFTSANDADAFGLISLGDTTANEVMGAVLNPAHNLIEFRRVLGGVALPAASVAITPPAAGVSTRCAIAWDADAGLVQIAARGTAGMLLTGQTSIPAITHVMPGRFSTTRPHFGGLRLAEIRPLAAFGATLAAMT